MEQKNNLGVAFQNKKTSDKQPDYKGKAIIDGKEKEVAIWVKKDKNGKDYFSISFSEPYKGGKDEEGSTPF